MHMATLVASVCLCRALAARAGAPPPATSTEDHWRLLAAQSEAEAAAGDPPPVMPTNGTFFAGSLTDNAVLQKGTAHAAVYGVSFGASSKTKVTVTVAEEGQPSYTVDAEMIPIAGHESNVTWKALLHPHAEQGGSATISAACSGCTNTTAAVIKGVTWGDVWFCFGQVWCCQRPD
jgi:hypothetical protein